VKTPEKQVQTYRTRIFCGCVWRVFNSVLFHKRQRAVIQQKIYFGLCLWLALFLMKPSLTLRHIEV